VTTAPTRDRLHLAVGLRDAGWHPAGWRDAGARPTDLFGAAYWVDLAREAERGVLDLLTLDDAFGAQSERPDRVRGRLDATLVAARIAPRTRHIGIAPVASTTFTEPFRVSTQIATLDFVSEGRGGWLARVSDSVSEGAHVGRQPSADVFDEAADHVEVVRRLWDSWEDDAVIRDAATSRFLDREKVHHIDFVGRHFSVKGPSITPRPPQGQPIVLAHAGGPATGFAAGAADILLLAPRDEGELEALLGEVVDSGRHVFADVVVALDDRAGAARERLARLDDLDGARYAPDALVLAGTPAETARELTVLAERGVTGFRLLPAAIPHDVRAIARGLVPELQARGAFPRSYAPGTLRERLGLARPANRYAAA
jgi:alkanesulfonate monooxygenase SsuD/methylene tetrahydromethanopterin reductase-like flavin-dependent oxidoreductase (luciferase family)